MSDSHAIEKPLREVRYEHTRDFVDILRGLGSSLLVSTYQAGKVVVLGTRQDGLALSFHNFHQAMGCAVGTTQLAVGGKSQIWFLQKAEAVVAQLPVAAHHDACFLTRSAHYTSSIELHELAWCDNELWFVNTLFSCLCSWDREFSFVPRWRPPFIHELAAEDRCHLNGLCVVDGRPRYVTAMSETDSAEGWRAVKSSAGCLLDVGSGEVVARGFAMPHSPRMHQGQLWVLDSGRGRLVTVDLQTGKIEPISQQPGYTRGLALSGPFAFVGLSRIRETATFGGLPLESQRDQLKCAVAVIDLRTGKRVAHFEFLSGVEEIFDLQLMPDMRNPFLAGPFAEQEGGQAIWYAPSRGVIPSRLPFVPPVDREPMRPVTDLDRSHASPSSQSLHTEAVFSQLATSAEAYAAFQLGNQLVEADQFESALAHFQRAVDLNPQFAEALCNYGLNLQFLGRFPEAIRWLSKAIEVSPDAPAPHLNLAVTLFLNGELRRAWHEYEWRWKSPRLENRLRAASQIAAPWDGSSLAGRTLLVFGEQGIGDEVMFASCLPELLEQTARCILACEPRLVPLFARSFSAASVVSMEALQEPHSRRSLGRMDYQIPIGSLPRLLRGSRADFPRASYYLHAARPLVEAFGERLKRHATGLRVGISWRGGSTPEERRRRSSELRQWQPILALPNITFVSLQYGDTTEELAALQAELGVTVEHWSDVNPLVDLDRFAAQIAALDLVVTIDNSTLHFAGALGVPTFGLISFPSSSSWRWFAAGDETVWYPQVRLFRRQHPDPWQGVLQRVADEIRHGFLC